MNFSRLRAGVLVATLALAGCSGDHGFLGTNYQPSGDILIGVAGSPTLLHTTATNPYQATGGFTLGLRETNFNGSFNVVITKWSNGFNIPCYAVHKQSNTLFTFSTDNANPATDPPTQANPCVANSGDIEQAEVDDGIGNSTYFYYELV